MPQLDSIRAVAVSGVMLWHFWGAPFALLGVVGVLLFFVLSGFLITAILLRGAREHSVRRPRRLLRAPAVLYPSLLEDLPLVHRLRTLVGHLTKTNLHEEHEASDFEVIVVHEAG